MVRSGNSSHALVHGLVGQAVGFSILFTEGMADGEPVEFGDQFFGAPVQILQRCVFYLVDALNLADQQLRVANNLDGLGTVVKRVFESGDQALILGEIVGLVAEVFAELRDFSSGLILDDDAVASGAGIAAGAAVAVCDQVVLGWIFTGEIIALGKERLAAGERHADEFTTETDGDTVGNCGTRSRRRAGN